MQKGREKAPNPNSGCDFGEAGSQARARILQYLSPCPECWSDFFQLFGLIEVALACSRLKLPHCQTLNASIFSSMLSGRLLFASNHQEHRTSYCQWQARSVSPGEEMQERRIVQAGHGTPRARASNCSLLVAVLYHRHQSKPSSTCCSIEHT